MKFAALPGAELVRWSPRADTRHLVNLKSCELQFDDAIMLVRQAVSELDVVDVLQYPAESTLRARLSALWSIAPDCMALCAGSSAAIAAVIDAFAFPAGRLIIQDPAYALWPHLSTLRGVELVRCKGVVGWPPRTSIDEFADALSSGPRAVAAITNPTNPIGDLIEMGDMRSLCEIALRRGHLFVVDDCYGDFADSAHASLIDEYPCVLVIRSLSKSWGLAGARLGVVVGPPDAIAILQKLRLDASVSGPALSIAARLASQPEKLIELWSKVQGVREWFVDAMQSSQPEWRALPSTTNFVTFATTHPGGGDAIAAHLDRHRIRTSSFDELDGLHGCIRISLAERRVLRHVVDAAARLREDAPAKG